MIVYKGLYPRILIGIRTGIAMDGHKVVALHRIGLLGLLLGGFIDVRGSGIIHLHSILLQNPSHRQGQRQRVVLFLPALVHRSRIAAAMSGIYHHHTLPPHTLYTSYVKGLVFVPAFCPLPEKFSKRH